MIPTPMQYVDFKGKRESWMVVQPLTGTATPEGNGDTMEDGIEEVSSTKGQKRKLCPIA